MSEREPLAMRDRRPGRVAVALAAVAATCLAASTLLTAIHENQNAASAVYDAVHYVRGAVILLFMLSGPGALGCSLRALHTGDRRAVVWAAFAVGLLATLLTVAEFTVME